MSLGVKRIETSEELYNLFSMRYKVFVDEFDYFQPSEEKLFYDHYDTYPSTMNFIAIDDKTVIGGARVTQSTTAGMPIDKFMNCRKYLPDDAEKIGCGSMLCLEKNYRGKPHLMLFLFGMGYYWAVSRNITHMLMGAIPPLKDIYSRMGYRAVSEPVPDKKGLVSVPLIPMITDVRHPDKKLLNFVNKHLGKDYCLEQVAPR